MKSLSVNGVSYYQPEQIDEVKLLVLRAKQENKVIAMRGAAHSFPMAESLAQDSSSIHVMLSLLNKVTHFDHDKGIVTVQAGCHLGYDPYDPADVSTIQNSLLYQLDPSDEKGRRKTPPGWALPALGGITHQTIGGFTATGSAGGSVKFSLEEAIISVRIIYHGENGIEDKVFYRPENPEGDTDDPFWGLAFANLGLMGVIVEMTFQCEPAFNIKGKEVISKTINCSIDLFGSGNATKPSLAGFLRNTEYSRVLWWPQVTVKKVMVWSAIRQDALNDWPAFKAKPYKEVPFINGSPVIATFFFDLIFTFIGRVCFRIEHRIEQWVTKTPAQQYKFKKWFANMVAKLLKVILRVLAPEKQQDFHDTWWQGLPMDNQMSDRLAPVWFTELSFALDKAADVMKNLEKFYKDPLNAGTFCCELYGGKKNLFWLSPAYGTDVIRVDVYWFANNAGDPVEYFERIWKHLKPFNYRCHWGKYLPLPHEEESNMPKEALYPKWNQFMNLRKLMDPYNIFMTQYWKEHLGINSNESKKHIFRQS